VEERATAKAFVPSAFKPFRVLFFCASPELEHLGRARVDKEHNAIQKQIRQSKWIVMKAVFAARKEELQEMLYDFDPHMIHFSGHCEIGQLILEDSTFNVCPVIEAQCQKQRSSLQGSILNACNSDDLVTAVPSLGFTICTTGEIGDDMAITFAEKLYLAIALTTTACSTLSVPPVLGLKLRARPRLSCGFVPTQRCCLRSVWLQCHPHGGAEAPFGAGGRRRRENRSNRAWCCVCVASELFGSPGESGVVLLVGLLVLLL
jgi:hypothetical protein